MHISVEIPHKPMYHPPLIADVGQAQHYLCGEIASLSTCYYFHVIPKSFNNLQLSEYTGASLLFRFANKNIFSATTVKI